MPTLHGAKKMLRCIAAAIYQGSLALTAWLINSGAVPHSNGCSALGVIICISAWYHLLWRDVSCLGATLCGFRVLCFIALTFTLNKPVPFSHVSFFTGYCERYWKIFVLENLSPPHLRSQQFYYSRCIFWFNIYFDQRPLDPNLEFK